VDWVTTSTILQQLREFENATAWQLFVQRFHAPILAFVRRMGMSAQDAEDVAQESLLAFAESYRAGKYDREKGRLSSWLFGIAYRQVLRQKRRIGRRREVHEADYPSLIARLPDERGAADLWERSWEEFLLKECLARVQREVQPGTFRAFELTVREDRPPGDVAGELGVTTRAVYNAKHRVLKRVRELRVDLERMDESRALPGS
jgi:RNA polymerase sigma factor (sigma-70 family)